MYIFQIKLNESVKQLILLENVFNFENDLIGNALSLLVNNLSNLRNSYAVSTSIDLMKCVININ